MRNRFVRPGMTAAIVFGVATALAACADSTEILPDGTGANQPNDIAAIGGKAPEGQRRSFTRRSGAGGTAQLSVNPFLWRAALDTISFMPIATADAYGGAIITDWYSPPETPDERFKVNVLVQGAELQSDGVKVTLFRQARDAGGTWSTAPTENNTAIDLENVIITRARELRQQQTAQ